MKSLKTLVIIVLALSLVVGIALPAFASSKAPASSAPLSALKPDPDKDKGDKVRIEVIKGKITEISGKVITVNGKQVTTDDQTRFVVQGLGKNATLADIKVGMDAAVQGFTDEGKFYARHIVAVKKPIITKTTGNVTAYSYDATVGGNITIQEKSGTTLTFEILAGKLNIEPKGAQVRVGGIVTVVARQVPGKNSLVATSIIVHRPPLKQITGIITALTEPPASGNFTGTITVESTTLKYDANTVFTLRGALGIKIGQQATVIYRDWPEDAMPLAKKVLVGIRPPAPKPLPALATAARAVKAKANKD